MIKLISKTEEIIERLRKEGKVTEIELTSEQIDNWDNQMEEIRRDSIIKQAKSWQSAKDVWLD
jgi:hypothetical protein